MKRYLLLCFLAVPLLLFSANTPQQNLEDFLHKYISLSVYQMHEMQAGKPQIKILQTEDPTEVAVFGIVRVDSTLDAFVSAATNITEFKKIKRILQIGKFSNPPQESDVSALQIDKQDLEAIGKCVPGNCDIQLSDTAMERLRTAKDVPAIAKTMLVEYVSNYLQGGNKALSTYHDQKNPMRLASEFDTLLNNSTYVHEYLPELQKYLTEFPNGQLAGTENFIIWQKSKFHKKPIIWIDQVTIYKPNDQVAVIASKMIYASRFFDASLDLLGVQNATPQPGVYLIYLRRSRTGSIKGSLGVLRKQVVQNELRDQLEQDLNELKKRLKK